MSPDGSLRYLRAAPAAVLVGALALGACDDAARRGASLAASASASAASARASAGVAASPPPRDGCARTGSLDGAEADPACALASTSDETMRETMKRVQIGLEIDPEVITPGGTALLHLTLTNTSKVEVLVVFDAYPRAPGPLPDWSRIAGVTAAAPAASATVETPRLSFLTTTLDAQERSVDATPTVPGSIAAPSTPKLVGVRLRPGGKLTHIASWWALRIPAPAPIVVDDAGHRYITKTMPVPLWPGEYSVRVDLPLHGVPPPERAVSVHVRVAP